MGIKVDSSPSPEKPGKDPLIARAVLFDKPVESSITRGPPGLALPSARFHWQFLRAQYGQHAPFQ